MFFTDRPVLKSFKFVTDRFIQNSMEMLMTKITKTQILVIRIGNSANISTRASDFEQLSTWVSGCKDLLFEKNCTCINIYSLLYFNNFSYFTASGKISFFQILGIFKLNK